MPHYKFDGECTENCKYYEEFHDYILCNAEYIRIPYSRPFCIDETDFVPRDNSKRRVEAQDNWYRKNTEAPEKTKTAEDVDSLRHIGNSPSENEDIGLLYEGGINI